MKYASLLSSTPAIAFALSTCLTSAASAQEKVRVGIVNSSSDAGFLVAEKKGYFKQEGLEAEFTPFDSAARMVAPLGAGQLDVGGGSASAGLYNAVARGINVKVVADKGSTPRSYDYMPLLVRKELVDTGKVKSVADL